MDDAAVLVIGAGVVGSATAAVLIDGGDAIAAFDVDPSASERFPGPLLSREDCMRPWRLIVIAVPTPTRDDHMDAGPLLDALDLVLEIARMSVAPLPVAIRSTLVPTTMAGVVAPHLGQAAGVEACYWPCFARERSAAEDERSPRHTVIGAAEPNGHAATALRAAIAHLPGPISVVRPVEAELIKHGANLFNSLKISYFNALADWAAELGGEGQAVASLVAAVAEGAWNPGYGTRVGPAFGGACLDKDLQALSAALTLGGNSHLGLLHAIAEVNADPRRAPAQSLPPGAS